ncbi:MAG: NmrA family NAD(P)-binding protein [Chloroflexi bacterium]|nr:NmrA family NAD(P)-binding protein [Chloroflexota bacterium]
MKVLVTGGTGFVGSHTVAEVVRAGHDVKLLVRDPVGEPLPTFRTGGRFTAIKNGVTE